MALAEGGARVTWKEALREELAVGRVGPRTTSCLTRSPMQKSKARGEVTVGL